MEKYIYNGSRGKKLLYFECMKIKQWNTQTYIIEIHLVNKNRKNNNNKK